jgi:hypothetical protein
VINPDFDGRIFQPQETLVQFVGQNYLLRPGAVDGVVKFYEYIKSQSVFTHQLQALESSRAN